MSLQIHVVSVIWKGSDKRLCEQEARSSLCIYVKSTRNHAHLGEKQEEGKAEGSRVKQKMHVKHCVFFPEDAVRVFVCVFVFLGLHTSQ